MRIADRQTISRKQPEAATRAILFLLLLLAVAPVESSTDSRDKEALLYFKGNLSDPEQKLTSWSDLSDPCDDKWLGVFCSSGLSNRVVEQLSLPNLQLAADSVPSSLQNLQKLKSLDLGGNYFTGSIPVWLTKLEKLTSLSLVNNQLSGEIPPELSELSKTLETLKITNNSLTGNIPAEIGNLTQLNFFACESNKLTGPIPPSFSQLRAIEHLHMDHNLFTESLPDGLGSLPNLTHIVLNDNLLTGTLPNDLGSSTSLKHLKLDGNKISGEIPVSYGSLGSITDLRLRSNRLSGSIPNSFNNLRTLEVLDLSGNPLESTIPSFDNMVSIVSLSLAGCNLTGPIPDSFSDLSTLEIIDLSQNNLVGTIPSGLGLAGNLLSLQIQRNSITGSIPQSLQKPSIQFLAYGNPLCAESENQAINACVTPDLTQEEVPRTCICPQGMAFRPFLREGYPASGCDCVAPLIFKLDFPQVQLNRFSIDQQNRLEENVARELFLEIKQVLIDQPISTTGTGTEVTFSVFPLVSQSLDYGTVVRIQSKLNAPYPDQMWLDGEFGWFNYSVPLFVPPVVSDIYPPFPSESSKGSSYKEKVIKAVWISALVGGLLLAIITAVVCIFVCRRRRKRKNRFHHSEFSVPYIQGIVNKKATGSSPGSAVTSPVMLPRSSTSLQSFGPPVKIYTYEELAVATGDFGPDGLIGSGGFGSVYRGQLSDGTLVAVKKLTKKNSKQGEAEFRTEVEMIAHQLHSPHLVRLRGYCSQGHERLLVYDLMGRGSLFDYLRDSTRPPPVALLDWKTRIQIARDAAAGIRFLHECSPPVVHRDIKPSNILLDEQLNAKVADFGLSKSYPLPQSDHVTTRVVGTFGYLAPDYSITGKLTVKSDVYSFGVVLLEIISGKHSTVADDTDDDKIEQFLVPWAKPLLNDKQRVHEVLDPALIGAYPPKGLIKIAALVSSCLQLDPDRRPDMAVVHNVLSTVYEMPVLTPKAREQREALVASTYVFRSRSSSSMQSSSILTESSGGPGLPGPGPITPPPVSFSSNSSLKLSSTSGLSISSMVVSRGSQSKSDVYSDIIYSEDPSLYNRSSGHLSGRVSTRTSENFTERSFRKSENFAERPVISSERFTERLSWKPENLAELPRRASDTFGERPPRTSDYFGDGLSRKSESFAERPPRSSDSFGDRQLSLGLDARHQRSTSKLSFSSSGRHEESPARSDAPKTLVLDNLNPR
ncbi:hypothetical protein MPTK1_6g05940 [Marchantia polymorpha subsp. ruderalis]|uniref:Protein kinase domain-containing protein n=2 Tax=Marchantia polymorpha TaxID=3197 RepID=A0AAF6BP04_MARPO|nr:hypothetical protein MARPO_0097s0050 [Marchantia polymorpha]BAF79952.1 receptor-like kinase [Marchantia polymorpha]BBN13738.1 hypothetical protein Mp_6g05940 [Marchantia polymorpha subsp. ruderalis]|eukprot:PTQ32575.1 hypothetical protein MARPO_0097s0050 [Marchantia polymorpha]